MNLTNPQGDKTVNKLVALIILSCVFFPLAIGAMSLISIRSWVLDRSVYERMVSDERLYDAMLTGELPNQFNRSVFVDGDQLPLAAVNNALREVVTADYLRAQSLSVVDQVFDFIEGRSESVEVTFDITPIKAALRGEAATRFANTMAASLPSCAAGQPEITPGGRLVRCIADDSSVEGAAVQIAGALPAVLAAAPDQIVLNDPMYFRNDWGFTNWFRAGTLNSMLNVGILTLIAATLAAAVAGAYLGGDDRRGRLKWFGAALYVLRFGLDAARWEGIRYSEAFRQAVTDMILPLVQQIGSGFLLTGLVSGLIALIVLIWSWRTPSTEQPVGKLVQVPVRN
jgi:hypothetical protein